MKFVRSLLLMMFGLAFGAELHAAVPLVYLSQTNSFVANPSQSVSWNQFNPSLGTLSGITFEGTAGISGYFTVQNLDSASSMNVSDSKVRFSFLFSGSGAPPRINSSYLTPITTSPVSNSTGTDIPAGATQPFDVIGTQYFSLPSTDWFSFASYFTGSGTVSSVASQSINITSDGPNYLLNSTPTASSGSAILTYIYTVPEPSCVSLLALGLGGLVALRRCRRTDV